MHPPRAIPDLHAPVSTALRPSTTDLVGLAPQMFTRVTNLPGPARSSVASDPFALSGARSVSPDGSSCGSLSAPLGGAKTSLRLLEGAPVSPGSMAGRRPGTSIHRDAIPHPRLAEKKTWLVGIRLDLPAHLRDKRP